MTMKRQTLATAIALLALACSAGAARATDDPTGFPKGCRFEHPKKANYLKTGMVQAYVSCGNTGGNTPNTTTQGGVPACTPPETFNEQVGSPPNGWRFDPEKGRCSATFRSARNPVPPTDKNSPLNPPGCTADIHIEIHCAGIIDDAGLVSGTGGLATVARATLQDRGADGICGTSDDADMTVVDFPATFPFTLQDGAVSLDTSADSLLNGIGQPGLPHCSSIELVDVKIVDENGTVFAAMGVFTE
jgi:hypothetical protein